MLMGRKQAHLMTAISINLTYKQKFDIIKSHLSFHIDLHPDQQKTEWLLDKVLPAFLCLEGVISQRNSLVHGSYSYENFDDDGSIHLDRKKVKKGGVHFSFNKLNSDFRNEKLTEIVELYFEIDQIRIQISRWFDYFQQT